MKPNRKRILIADCHEDVLIVLEKLFEDAGFDATIVSKANEVLSLVDLYAFDLMLVSEYLPDAGCEEVLKALRRSGHAACIVMQTTAPENIDFARFEGLGVEDVVCKRPYPYIVEIVKERLLRDDKQIAAV